MIRKIPNLLTSFNLATGCIGIYFLLTGSELETLYFVLIAALFDVLDGMLARLLDAKSAIGGQLDSLADLVSFGLLPSFYVLTLLRADTPFFWGALLIVLFSAYRLAKFNTDKSQTDSFMGLPTPANAIMLSSLFLVPIELDAPKLFIIVFISSFALIVPVRLIALKFSSYSWSGNEPRWMLIIGGIILLLTFKLGAVPLLIPYYLLVSLIFYRKSKFGA